MYAQATFLSVSGTSASRRALIHGKCGALLVADNTFKQKFITGLLNTEECERVDASKVPADKMDDIELGAVCKRKGGQPDSTFDCGFFKQVGDTLLAVPLSMPVSPVLEKRYGDRYQCPCFLQHVACAGLKMLTGINLCQFLVFLQELEVCRSVLWNPGGKDLLNCPFASWHAVDLSLDACVYDAHSQGRVCRRRRSNLQAKYNLVTRLSWTKQKKRKICLCR
jgi:hypothetical protein